MASGLERFGYPDFRGTTILVIDDHQDSLDFLKELLGFCGASVQTAWSTAHARKWLETRLPSLVVCDFQLPRENGVDFIRWLRLLPDERGRIPAVAMTAYSEEFLRQHDNALAFDAYFVKPIEAPRFLRTLETILSRPPTPRQLRSA
jgi:CheY-like chemotaxis protein